MVDYVPAHVPVLADTVIGLLEPALRHESALVLDATVGLGGHAAALLEAAPLAHLVGLDADPAALTLAAQRLAPYEGRFTLIHARYDELGAALDAIGVKLLDAVLFDLGVSSMQLDDQGRGFSYAKPAPLDMRMDPTTGHPASWVLATYSQARLAQILRRYGDEPGADRIARAIVAARDTTPIETSEQLVELIREALPQALMRHGGHPAKRTFQALRIEVNQELEVLERALPQAVDRLALHGRLVAMSYHSGEDRVVKRVLAQGLTSPAPEGLPVVPPELQAFLAPLIKGSLCADSAEIARNPRAASVRVRAVQRIATIPRRLS